MSRWEPHIDLMRLLEALSTELAVTTETEVLQAGVEARWPLAEAAREVRELIGALNGDPGEAEVLQSIDRTEGGVERENLRHHRSVTERGNRTCCSRQH
jgi:hypothetical protein